MQNLYILDENNFIILNTTLTTELIEEGYAREFISKIQQIRKASNFDVLDNIDIDFCGDDEIAQAVENFKDYIKSMRGEFINDERAIYKKA